MYAYIVSKLSKWLSSYSEIDDILKNYDKNGQVTYCFRKKWDEDFESKLSDKGFVVMRYIQKERCFCDDNMLVRCNCNVENLKSHQAYRISKDILDKMECAI